uniref:Uncharacterized protein n=1 Tax=Manihot esculenta TaxID=3983 RepID=A0A2C9UHW0_MANES
MRREGQLPLEGLFIQRTVERNACSICLKTFVENSAIVLGWLFQIFFVFIVIRKN